MEIDETSCDSSTAVPLGKDVFFIKVLVNALLEKLDKTDEGETSITDLAERYKVAVGMSPVICPSAYLVGRCCENLDQWQTEGVNRIRSRLVWYLSLHPVCTHGDRRILEIDMPYCLDTALIQRASELGMSSRCSMLSIQYYADVAYHSEVIALNQTAGERVVSRIQTRI